MSAQQPTTTAPNGDYSNQQFNETRELPFTYRSWNSIEIEEFRRALVRSYTGCDDKDITYQFEPVDIDDPDKDCIWLIYRMSCIWGSEPITRTIYSKKMQLPERLRAKAAELLKNNNPSGATKQTFKGTYDESDSKWKPPSFNFRNVIKKNTAAKPSHAQTQSDCMILAKSVAQQDAYNNNSKLSVEDLNTTTHAEPPAANGPRIEEIDDSPKAAASAQLPQPDASATATTIATPAEPAPQKTSRLKRPVKAKK
ncbi:hypothetical protein D5b_00079 [Faustovirus]|nr:hypothetical protein D5b_00079 [Faustovirus]AMN84831.1 hypothetical protein D6_00431 [Faustovirus]AMP44037.1 hypothetical protein PRJ_Dakar_00078 [Faustovirus]